MSRRLTLWILTTLLLAGVGCSTTAPQLKVLGVSRPADDAATNQSTLVVFVEVLNPTHQDLHLLRMEYQMAARPWLDASGRVPLSRDLASDSTAVVAIPVPYRDTLLLPDAPASIPFELRGRLVSVDQRVERSWRVRVRGTIDRAALVSSTDGEPFVRARIAASE